MGKIVAKNVGMIIDTSKIASDLNTLVINYNTELLDDLTFGMSTKSRIAGLPTLALNGEGFVETGVGSVEETIFTKLTGAAFPFTITPETNFAAAGNKAFLSRLKTAVFSPAGKVGDLYGFTFSGEGAGDRLVNGVILEPGAVARTATFNGTGINIGTLDATKSSAGALHVLAASGTAPTLAVIVQADTTSAFLAPINVLAFATANAIGSQFVSQVGSVVNGPWFRILATIGGTVPSFTFIVSFGIFAI